MTFVVLDINLLPPTAVKGGRDGGGGGREGGGGGREGGGGGKTWSLAEAEIAREADLGLNDETYLRV